MPSGASLKIAFARPFSSAAPLTYQTRETKVLWSADYFLMVHLTLSSKVMMLNVAQATKMPRKIRIILSQFAIAQI